MSLVVDYATIKDSLEYWYHASEDDAFNTAVGWYENAHLEACRLAHDYELTLAQTSGIIARLSPAVPWTRNIIAAENLIKGKEKIDGYPNNVEKARDILAGKYGVDYISVLGTFPEKTAPKIRSFYENIFDPYRQNCIPTIDRWMVRAALCTKRTELKTEKVSLAEYRTIAYAIREIAEKYNLSPLQTQAVIWESVRVGWK